MPGTEVRSPRSCSARLPARLESRRAVEAALLELKRRLGEVAISRVPEASSRGTWRSGCPRRSRFAGDAALDARADHPRQVHRRPCRRAPRRARAVRGLAPARRRRRLPRAGHSAAVREAAAHPDRPRRGAHEGGRRGVSGLGRRARGRRLPGVPARARADAGADAAQGGVLRAVRRSLRRPPRRLRAGHAHRGRGRGLRRAAARAHRARRRARSRRGGRAPARAVRADEQDALSREIITAFGVDWDSSAST